MDRLSHDQGDLPNWHKNNQFPFKFKGKSMQTQTTKWSECNNRGEAIVEQKLGLEEIYKSKRLYTSQSGIQVGKLTI